MPDENLVSPNTPLKPTKSSVSSPSTKEVAGSALAGIGRTPNELKDEHTSTLPSAACEAEHKAGLRLGVAAQDRYMNSLQRYGSASYHGA